MTMNCHFIFWHNKRWFTIQTARSSQLFCWTEKNHLFLFVLRIQILNVSFVMCIHLIIAQNTGKLNKIQKQIQQRREKKWRKKYIRNGFSNANRLYQFQSSFLHLKNVTNRDTFFSAHFPPISSEKGKRILTHTHSHHVYFRFRISFYAFYFVCVKLSNPVQDI